jgi:hypothetical protein
LTDQGPYAVKPYRRHLLIFVHIPKTAGMSLRRLLWRKHVGADPIALMQPARALGYPWQRWPQRLERIANLPPSQQRRVRLMYGHFGYGVHTALPEPATYLTMLRDPMQRSISAYHFCMRRATADRPADTTLQQFLANTKQSPDLGIDNLQTRYLAGEAGHPVDAPIGQCPGWALERAKENLEHHFLIAGLTERFDETVVLLSLLMGWRTLAYQAHNQGTQRTNTPRSEQYNEPLAWQMNALDLKLYEFARQRFDQQCEQMGEPFHQRLSQLQQGRGFAMKSVRLLDSAYRVGGKALKKISR